MGKKDGSSSLGKGIIKNRSKKIQKVAESWLHNSELNDGYDWNRINLRSVTEQSNLDDFLETAELAGTEFTAERLNVKVIDPDQHTGLPSAEESVAITKAQKENVEFLQIPRRPKWDSTTTAEQLNLRERESFLEWRRQLSVLQEKEHIVLTPFERNLDFWRQLWRVIERSDIIVQIVDARNPLLFRCQDLEKYVKEVSEDKENMILISKADLLTQAQREHWAAYFSHQGIRVAFWSAFREEERLNQKEAEDDDSMSGNSEDDDEDSDSDGDDGAHEGLVEVQDVWRHLGEDPEAGEDISGPGLSEDVEGHAMSQEESQTASAETCLRSATDEAAGEKLSSRLSSSDKPDGVPHQEESMPQNEEAMEVLPSRTDVFSSADKVQSDSDPAPGPDHGNSDPSSHGDGDPSRHGDSDHPGPHSAGMEADSAYKAAMLMTGEQLLEFFKEMHTGRSQGDEEMTTIGMVGYPNVGKSSTINALLREKKVPVSATPGRTKHFQTLFVEPTLCLCDCPGLVMPSFVSTKAEMYLNGILPIDTMRDFYPPASMLCQLVPREVLELSYGFNLIKPGETEDPDRPPTALEFLNAHAYVRGYMTHKGVPDCFRSARIVLKDFVKGSLLYRVSPPGLDPDQFGSVHHPTEEDGEVKAGARPKKSANKLMIDEKGQTVKRSPAKVVDDSFFAKPSVAHMKAVPPKAWIDGQKAAGGTGVVMMGKPWKKPKRGKKEKLRRIYGHLDEK